MVLCRDGDRTRYSAPVEEMPSDGDLEVGIAQMVMSQSPCLPKSLPPFSLVEHQRGGGGPWEMAVD